MTDTISSPPGDPAEEAAPAAGVEEIYDISPSAAVLVGDASIFYPTKTGAWAAIARVDGRQVEDSGLLAGEIMSSMSAEMRGIANGFLMMRREGLLTPKLKLIVICDNEAVVESIKGVWRAKKKDVAVALERINQIVAEFQLELMPKHIRGHAAKKTFTSLPYVMNRRCDALAGPIARAEHERRLAIQTEAA